VEVKDEDEDTALHEASKNGHLEIVRLLLEDGAVVEVKNTWGETALDVAKANGHSEVVALLSDIMVRYTWIKMPL
jgi:ankyrin repeat protein